ncbi:MAG: hypothetical protein ACK4MM_06825 [Fervidobacterium sp.]
MVFESIGFSLQNIGNSTINATASNFIVNYFYSLPSLITQGDVAAITISFILFFTGLVVINKITSVLLSLIKKIIFFLITGIAVYYFFKSFLIRTSMTGLTMDNIIFGLAGSLIGLIGLGLSFYWLSKSFREDVLKNKTKLTKLTDLKAKEDIVEKNEKHILFSDASFNLLKQEKSILSIIIYLTIAEFGVFSSPTIAPPNPQIGFIFFLIFLTASIIFIKKIYSDFKLGLTHFSIAIFFGFILSIILGYFWGNFPLSELLSLRYFASHSVVALITGIAVSLFMSSR